MDRVSDAIFVVRSVGERTERACMQALCAAGVAKGDIVLVNERPFSKALEAAYVAGRDSQREWTFCVDADVILRRNAVQVLLRSARGMAPTAFGLDSMMLDKFTMAIRAGGVHLYRSRLLQGALAHLQHASKEIRPETAVKRAVAAEGHAWLDVPFVAGIHDFEQYYEDIFRKCYVHANKHMLHLPRLIPAWRALATEDPDFRVAIEGLALGLRESGVVLIDKGLPQVEAGWASLGLPERTALTPCSNDSLDVEQILGSWAVGRVEVHGHSASREALIASDGQLSNSAAARFVRRFRDLSSQRGAGRAAVATAGLVLTHAGQLLSRWAFASNRRASG